MNTGHGVDSGLFATEAPSLEMRPLVQRSWYTR
jgi:hypothetical protein